MLSDRVFICGGYGMLAGHVIPHLSGRKLYLGTLPDSRPIEVDTKLPHPATVNPSIVQVINLDITDYEAVENTLVRVEPAVIINCAAYTAVDRAQSDYGSAFAVNAIGPRNLALVSRKLGAHLIHISSDYVFGGANSPAGVPLTETTPPSPCGIYGESKRFGDELALAVNPDRTTILRTSWLHGLYGPNFVETMLKLGKTEPELRIVNDQFGSPTWADWLAEVIAAATERRIFGLFNVSCRGGITWFDFATEIMRSIGSKTLIKSQTSAELNRPAPRPAYSVLDLSAVELALGRNSPDWKDGLRQHLQQRGVI